MLLNDSIRTRTHNLNLNLNYTALLISVITSVGLSACSTQQMSKPIAETTSSTVNQEDSKQEAPANKSFSSPVVVVETASMSKMTSADYTSNSVNSSTILTRSAPQSNIIRPSPIAVTPEAHDNYQKNVANPVHRTTDMAVATLSIDTDTGSYANVRRYLNEGQLPPVDAVRVEEMMNYFNYQFEDGKRLSNAPFIVATEVVDSPWDKAD